MGCICAKEAPVRDDTTGIRSERARGSKRRASASGRLTPIDVGTGVDASERDQVQSNAGTKKLSGDERKNNQWIPVEPIAKLRNLPKQREGEQVAAGWPAWLSAVAGEAIKGWIPRRADSFEKLDKIGQGTYSNVYKARDLDSGKIVALKKVRFDNLEPESVRFMAREIQVLRRLDHPNIVKLEGLVTSRMSCSLYLVFEYMEHDLAGLAACPGTAFTEPQVKCYLQQLLRGLDHCHSHEVLHRDIKGSNLLISNSGILKIADFGLATFFRADQKQPLTSRVVTLWYRPPELLLGATEYGVAVDLWSAGCILAELLAGKPIMPGRTEVEQLHKIFKLCGSPSEDFWRKSKLPHATIFKPKQPYRRCLAETYKEFPPPALSSLETLLAIEPADRGTAALALKSDFFTTKPLACDPSSLPKYPPSKELDAKLRDEEARRQRAAGGRAHGADVGRRIGHLTKAGPVPDANAELAASIQKRRMMTHATKSKSEKFHPNQEDPAVGFPIGPSRQGDVIGTYVPTRRVGPLGNPNAVLMSFKKQKEDESSLAPHLSSRSTKPLALPAQTSDLSSISSLVAARNNSATHQTEIAPKGVEGAFVKNMAYHNQQPRAFSGKASRIHFSGPLLHPSSNVEDMLGEHERQIQQAVRRARQDKARNQRASKPRASDSSEGASEIPEFGRRDGPLTFSGRWKPPRAQPNAEEIIELCEPDQGLWSVVEHNERELDT